MARIEVEPGLCINCEVTDYLWPWTATTPVVMMHGGLRTALVWNRWIPTLSGRYRIYRPELRGCGDSDVPPPGPMSMAMWMQDLIKMLDELGLERVHWIGESTGGVLVTMMAGTYPERTASLVLCDTPLKMTAGVVGLHALGESRPGAGVLKYGTAEWCRRTLSARLDTERAPKELQEWYVAQFGRAKAHVGEAILDACVAYDSEPLLPNITSPVLVLYGEKSTSATPEHRDIMRRKLARTEFHPFPGYGHGVSLLLPEECARIAVEFFDKIDAPAPASS